MKTFSPASLITLNNFSASGSHSFHVWKDQISYAIQSIENSSNLLMHSQNIVRKNREISEGVGITKLNWVYSGSKDETFGNLMTVAVGGGDDGGSSDENGNIGN
ncbi:hypothetical protein YC2023_041130 [Brassica napus]